MKTLLPIIDRNVEVRPRADKKFEKWDLERTKTSFSLIGAPGVFYKKLDVGYSPNKNFVDRDHHLYRLMLKKNINRLKVVKCSEIFYSHCSKKSKEDDAMYCSSCGKSLSSTKGIGNIAECSASVSPPDSESIGLGLSLNEPVSQTKKIRSSRTQCHWEIATIDRWVFQT